MNDRRCEIWERIRAWPGDPVRRRSPPPPSLDFKTNSGRRSTRQDNPAARETAPKDDLDIRVSDEMSRALHQVSEIHAVLSSIEAHLQNARVRLHILDAALAGEIEQGARNAKRYR